MRSRGEQGLEGADGERPKTLARQRKRRKGLSPRVEGGPLLQLPLLTSAAAPTRFCVCCSNVRTAWALKLIRKPHSIALAQLDLIVK